METNHWLMIAIFILGSGSLIGFFISKTEGFGRFTTSPLLVIFVVTFSSLLYAGGKLESQVMANVLFAVFGFAGGLFTSKDGS
ncbi:MAG: hypothetical protein Q9M30_09375 [Mariprofundaceae bacterium]|nr:hypothetical protein [Mariprofundaceae bacterium]